MSWTLFTKKILLLVFLDSQQKFDRLDFHLLSWKLCPGRYVNGHLIPITMYVFTMYSQNFDQTLPSIANSTSNISEKILHTALLTLG